MELLIPEYVPQYSVTNTDIRYEKSGCEHWIPSDSKVILTCESGSGAIKYKNFNLNLPPQSVFFNTQMPLSLFSMMEVPKIKTESQLNTLFSHLTPSFTFLNQRDIILFLEENGITPDEILICFTEVNKLVFSRFQENVKMFVQKYDDPETKDHFISIDIRHKEYPDDFIDNIWEIRDIFSDKFKDNSWLLITTDYKSI